MRLVHGRRLELAGGLGWFTALQALTLLHCYLVPDDGSGSLVYGVRLTKSLIGCPAWTRVLSRLSTRPRLHCNVPGAMGERSAVQLPAGCLASTLVPSCQSAKRWPTEVAMSQNLHARGRPATSLVIPAAAGFRLRGQSPRVSQHLDI